MCYFELIYLTACIKFQSLAYLLKFVLPLVASTWQNHQKAARQVSNKSATNPLSSPRNRVFETAVTSSLTPLFLTSCPSQHHLCANPIISGLIAKCLKKPFCSTFWLLSALSSCFITSWSRRCGMMGPIFVFTSHHCTSATQPQYTSERTCTHTRACTPPAVAFKCMATFPAYMAHGVPSLQRSVRSLLISSVSRPGSLPRACHGRVTLLDDRTMRFQAVVSQTRWLVSTKHISPISPTAFIFVAMPSRKSTAQTNTSLTVSWWRWIEFEFILATKLEATLPYMFQRTFRDCHHWEAASK